MKTQIYKGYIQKTRCPSFLKTLLCKEIDKCSMKLQNEHYMYLKHYMYLTEDDVDFSIEILLICSQFYFDVKLHFEWVVERFYHCATHLSVNDIGPSCTCRQVVLHRLLFRNAHNIEEFWSNQSPVLWSSHTQSKSSLVHWMDTYQLQ